MAAQQYLERTICSALLQLQLPQVEGSHMLVVGRWGFGGTSTWLANLASAGFFLLIPKKTQMILMDDTNGKM